MGVWKIFRFHLLLALLLSMIIFIAILYFCNGNLCSALTVAGMFLEGLIMGAILWWIWSKKFFYFYVVLLFVAFFFLSLFFVCNSQFWIYCIRELYGTLVCHGEGEPVPPFWDGLFFEDKIIHDGEYIQDWLNRR